MVGPFTDSAHPHRLVCWGNGGADEDLIHIIVVDEKTGFCSSPIVRTGFDAHGRPHSCPSRPGLLHIKLVPGLVPALARTRSDQFIATGRLCCGCDWVVMKEA